MRARQQAGHMDASDLIKSLQRQPCEEGAVHIWGPDADWQAKLLIYQAMEGSILDAYLHLVHVETFFARNLGGLIHARTRVPGRLGKATSRTPSMCTWMRSRMRP